MVKAKEYCSPTGSKTTFFRQIKAEMTQKKTWSGPFDKNKQRDCGNIHIYIYIIIIDIYVYQIISNILYTSIAWVFLFKPAFYPLVI